MPQHVQAELTEADRAISKRRSAKEQMDVASKALRDVCEGKVHPISGSLCADRLLSGPVCNDTLAGMRCKVFAKLVCIDRVKQTEPLLDTPFRLLLHFRSAIQMQRIHGAVPESERAVACTVACIATPTDACSQASTQVAVSSFRDAWSIAASDRSM